MIILPLPVLLGLLPPRLLDHANPRLFDLLLGHTPHPCCSTHRHWRGRRSLGAVVGSGFVTFIDRGGAQR